MRTMKKQNEHDDPTLETAVFLISRRITAAFYWADENKRADNPRPRATGYRLCVYASGSLITDIFSSLTHISVSCLHFGQNSGKFLSTVSIRIFVRVLLLQIGQLIHSIIIQSAHCSRNDWQEHLCPCSRHKYFPLVPKPVHQNRHHFSGW